ncbi:MAG TPA: hypothetical protein VD886_25175, partial [Herpetosiphonaceae bacterium]|nr:hypothetical protein [Herpetosiphonaceae bacterium]
TASFSDESLSDGFDIPSIDWGGLVDFSNLSPVDILNGLGQLVSSLGALEQLGSPDLPFLQGSFASVLDFTAPLLDFLRQQGDAAMVCGTQDSDPPLGSIRDLPANTPVYCQAVTFLGSTAATWSIANGTVTTNGTATSTVGQNPTDNVEFLLTSAGTPDISLSFTDSNDAVHQTALRFNTAQELIEKLQDLAGIDGAVSYDAATTALTFNLSKSFTAPSEDIDLNFGDQLRDATNLIGLSEGSGASASVGPSDLQFDVTFGAVLDPDFDEDLADRFFIKVGTGADEYELSASTAVAANLDLEGRLGFLKVQASGDASANPDDASAFVIEKIDDAKPMLGLNIIPPAGGVSVPGRPAIADAIQLTTLMSNTLSHLDVDINVRMSAGLRVSASVGEPATELASGKVGIVWADITSGTPAVTADGDFNEQLKSLDISPGVRGSHTGSANAATLTDSGKTFSAIAGLNGSKLHNLTDGSDCTITSVGANTLTCALSGGTDNDWDTGDRYDVDANPLAMLSVILDKLEMLANLLDSLAGTDVGSYLTDDLPFVGVSPKELISQFAELLDVINQIRTGAPAAAQMRCGTNNTLPPTGSLKAVPDGATIYCQAVTNERKVHSATWSVSGGELQGQAYASAQPSASFRARSVSPQAQKARRAAGHQVFLPIIPGVAVPIDAVASVGKKPTANMAFVVDDGDRSTATTDASDFNVQVSFKGSNGVHVSSLNSSVIDSIPTSLQELETVIEDALGLPAQALQFEIADLPVPGSTSPDGVQDLVIRLGYGRCTNGNPDCTASSVQVPVLEFPIKLDLGSSNPDLIGVNADSSIEISYAATAQLDLAIPLKASFDANSVVAVDTSGVVLSADIDTDDLNLSANVGPLTVNLGTT